MIVAWEGSDVLVLIARVPELNGEIGAAAGEECPSSRTPKIDI